MRWRTCVMCITTRLHFSNFQSKLHKSLCKISLKDMTRVNIKWKTIWNLSRTGFVWFIACKRHWCRSTQQPRGFTLHPEGLWIALHYSDLVDFMISWKHFLCVSHTPRAHRSTVALFLIFSTICTVLLLLHRFPAHHNKNKNTFSGLATPDNIVML